MFRPFSAGGVPGRLPDGTSGLRDPRVGPRSAPGHGRGQNHSAAGHADGGLLRSAGVCRACSTTSTPRRWCSTTARRQGCHGRLRSDRVAAGSRARSAGIIAEKTGIPADNVVISATHTHTGPVLIGDSVMERPDHGRQQAEQGLHRATAEVDCPGGRRAQETAPAVHVDTAPRMSRSCRISAASG